MESNFGGKIFVTVWLCGYFSSDGIIVTVKWLRAESLHSGWKVAKQSF
jgi:hypothetical protein